MEGVSTRCLSVVAVIAGALLMLGSVTDWSGVEYSSRLDRRLAFAAGAATVAVALAALAWRLGGRAGHCRGRRGPEHGRRQLRGHSR